MKKHHSIDQLSTCLFIFLIVAGPLIFLGYGSDNDTYAILDATHKTWELGAPTMSRHPGYWLYESLFYALNKIGGYPLVNAASLVASAWLAKLFYDFIDAMQVPHKGLITLCLVLNPWYLIASTSSMDYIFALLFIALSIRCLNANRLIYAGLAAGLAIGTRLSSAFIILGILAFSCLHMLTLANFKRLFVVGLLAAMIGSLFFVPSWYYVGKSFYFLTPHMSGQDAVMSIQMRLGRVIYRPIYLYGLVSTVLLAFLLMKLAIQRTQQQKLVSVKSLMPFLGGAAGNFLLFAKYPLEPLYLLPFLFFSYLVLAELFKNKPRIFWVILLISTVSYNLVSLPLAKAVPNPPYAAKAVKYGLYVEEGVLVDDIRKRMRYLSCTSYACFVQHYEHGL